MASSIRSKMRCVLIGLMYETASRRVYKNKRCVLFITFRPSQRTLFMARRNWVPPALKELIIIFLFVVTAAGVVPCGIPKKRPVHRP